MLSSQKDSKRRGRRKRYSNYVPADFDQKVPFIVRRIEEEEPEDDWKRDSLTEAVKIHWTAKGESEEELEPFIDEEEEDLIGDPLNPTGKPKKVSESTVEESVSLYSYVPEPEPEIIPEPEVVVEVVEKPKKKKERNKKSEDPPIEMSEVPEEVVEEVTVEVEALGEEDMDVPEQEEEVVMEANSVSEFVAKSEVDSLSKLEVESIEKSVVESVSKCATETVSEWEPKFDTKLDQEDEASIFSEDGDQTEMVVETEEIKLQMVDPPKCEDSDEEDETTSSYTWLLGPTSDEVILDAVEFFAYVASFIQDPIGFGHRDRQCCNKSKLYESGDCTENEEELD